MIKNIISVFFIVQTFLVCSCGQYKYTAFVEYLRAERDLRARISDQQELQDSIVSLQNKYNIDPEKEIAKLNTNEKVWISFLMELSRAR